MEIIYFGKVDYDNVGRNDNLIQVEIELKKHSKNSKLLDDSLLPINEDYYTFSVTGGIWDRRKFDFLTCGQCLDTILELIPNNKLFKRIHKLWKLYHLNDLQAGTKKQQRMLDKYADNNYEYDNCIRVLKKHRSYNDKGYEYGAQWLLNKLPVSFYREYISILKEIA